MEFPELLGAFRRFSSTDLDAARAYIGGVFKPHALRAGRDHRNAHVTVNSRGAGPWSTIAFGYGGASVEVDPGPLEAFYLLQFALRGSCTMRYGATDVALDATSAACLSPHRAMRGRFPAGTHMLVVRLERRAVERYFGPEPALGSLPLEFEPHIDLRRPSGQRLAHTVRRLVAKVERDDLAGADDLAQSLIATLCNKQNNSWQRYQRELGISQARQIVLSIDEYMRDRVADDLDVAHLAAMAGVSPRTMFAAFRADGKPAPMAYLRDLRIERAHRELTSEDADSVTGVALRCGFSHLGRFSALYRVRYGHAPSALLRKARGTQLHSAAPASNSSTMP